MKSYDFVRIFLRKIDSLLSKSKLTEADTTLFGRKVNKAVAKRLKELK